MLQRGTVLSGTYRIDSVLGEGGMAVVYAATHLRFNVRRAVKVLHEGAALKDNIRARFVREGKVATSVKHEGAVEMIADGFTDDGSPYLVMELLDGVSIDALSSRAIPLNAALNIAFQVLDVLRAAHENGIIHRDIKPANLFVQRNGQVKVLDFGISRLHDGAEPFDSQATGSVMGTPFFMAPEQARADPSEVDTRTDLFAVGATLFKLISGWYVHPGDDSRQVVFQAATRHARSLDSVSPGTPRAVVDLVAKAVAFDKDARWASAQAMQAAVLQVHETLCGPLEVQALATLLRTREFQRKSHARLTSPPSHVLWASNHVESSPLSTTLPVVAGSTRSVESYRPTLDSGSNREAPNSRISAEPLELAGWTGQVPAQVKSSASANGDGSRFGGALRRARVVRVGLLGLALGAGVFGFARLQTEPRAVAAKLAPNAVPSPGLPYPVDAQGVKPDATALTTTLPTSSEQQASAPGRRRPPTSLPKGAPPKAVSTATVTQTPAPNATAADEPVKHSPTLAQPRD